MRARLPLVGLALAAAAAGCGSSSTGPAPPTIPAAHVYRLAGFEPTGVVEPGKPVTLAFSVVQPSGRTLTRYRRGAGPHTGVHLILVRSDLASMIHRHPPVGADGHVSQTVVFPSAGRYRLVVDVYPEIPDGPRNFQLFTTLRVGKPPPVAPLPSLERIVAVGDHRFVLHGPAALRAIQPAFLDVVVSGPKGPGRFAPWYGALAHAIFFRAGTLDYFHTHVCGARTVGCTSVLGPTSVRGSARRGRLRVGVLLPVPGTWRLFLQTKVDGRVLTAPFTLKVR